MWIEEGMDVCLVGVEGRHISAHFSDNVEGGWCAFSHFNVDWLAKKRCALD